MIIHKLYYRIVKIRFGNCTNCFKVKCITSVFRGLELISHCFAQFESIWRSELLIPSISLFNSEKS